MVELAYVIGFSAPCATNCFTRPGWAMSAIVGGCPPATAVDRTCGMLSPTGLYVTWTFGYGLLKAAITALKDCASGPVHTPSSVIEPDTLDGVVAVVAVVAVVPPELLFDPPQPAAATRRTAVAATTAAAVA